MVVVSSVWLEISCIPWLVGTRTLVQGLLALALALTPCPEAGSPSPVLVLSPEAGRLVWGANLSIPRIKTLDQCSHNRRPTVGLIPRLPQATTRTIRIVTEIRPVSGPRATPDVTDEGVMIARGRGTGIGTVRGGAPGLGKTRSSIDYHPPRPEATPIGPLGLNGRSYPPLAFHFPTYICWRDNEKKL